MKERTGLVEEAARRRAVFARYLVARRPGAVTVGAWPARGSSPSVPSVPGYVRALTVQRVVELASRVTRINITELVSDRRVQGTLPERRFVLWLVSRLRRDLTDERLAGLLDCPVKRLERFCAFVESRRDALPYSVWIAAAADEIGWGHLR